MTSRAVAAVSADKQALKPEAADITKSIISKPTTGPTTTTTTTTTTAATPAASDDEAAKQAQELQDENRIAASVPKIRDDREVEIDEEGNIGSKAAVTGMSHKHLHLP